MIFVLKQENLLSIRFHIHMIILNNHDNMIFGFNKKKLFSELT